MIYLLLTATFFSSCLTLDEDLCTTPNNTQGECRNIISCPPLVKLLQSGSKIKPEEKLYLRQSQCPDYEGILPKVCCPFDEMKQMHNSSEAHSSNVHLLPSLEDCGIDATQDKIYGGTKTELLEFPWMALIHHQRSNGRGGFHCGGVLISSRYVLTAAHCIKGKKLPSSWTINSVRLGEYDLDQELDCETFMNVTTCAPPSQNILVEERIVHEDYDPNDRSQQNDIALLRLSTSADISSDYVKPICLPIREDQPQIWTGKNLTAAGWGKTENSTKVRSNLKLKVKLPKVDTTYCMNLYNRSLIPLTDKQFCAGGVLGKDSCNGDSGGPLMSYDGDSVGNVNWYVHGIVSFGPKDCGIENWPGVYVKVSNYVPWILRHLRP